MKPKKKSNLKRCEGWRRYGGAFTLGPVTWEQCKENGIVMLTFERDGKQQTLPACKVCWQEYIDTKLKIISAIPI